jgi:hypothetical protein
MNGSALGREDEAAARHRNEGRQTVCLLPGPWEKWKDRKAGIELLTFTVIPTDPNEVVDA